MKTTAVNLVIFTLLAMCVLFVSHNATTSELPELLKMMTPLEMDMISGGDDCDDTCVDAGICGGDARSCLQSGSNCTDIVCQTRKDLYMNTYKVCEPGEGNGCGTDTVLCSRVYNCVETYMSGFTCDYDNDECQLGSPQQECLDGCEKQGDGVDIYWNTCVQQ